VRKGFLYSSKSFIFMQKIAISGVYPERFVCCAWMSDILVLRLGKGVLVVLVFKFVGFFGQVNGWLENDLNTLNPSEGVVREGLLRFYSFHPSEWRWRERQKFNLEGRRTIKIWPFSKNRRKSNWSTQLCNSRMFRSSIAILIIDSFGKAMN